MNELLIKIKLLNILIVFIITLLVFTSCQKNNSDIPNVASNSIESANIPISTQKNTLTGTSSKSTIKFSDVVTPNTQSTFSIQEADKTHTQNPQNKKGYLSGDLVNDIVSLFPEGQVEVKVMKVGVPPENRKRYDEILNKIVKQYETHKKQFDEELPYDFGERIDKLKVGDPNYFLTWNPIFGVDANKINELQQLKDFYVTSKGLINIEQQEKNIIRINTVKNIENINKIEINLSNKTISTDCGVYNYDCYRNTYTEPPKVIADKWNLHEWRIDPQLSMSPSIYPVLYIGQLVKTKEIIIYFRTLLDDNIIFSFSPKV